MVDRPTRFEEDEPSSEKLIPRYTEKLIKKQGKDLQGMGRLLRKISGGSPTLYQKKMRSDVLRLNSQFDLTQKMVMSNMKKFQELAKSDEKIANLVSISERVQSEGITNLRERLERGEALSGKQTTKLITAYSDLTEAVEQSRVSLDVQFSDIARNMKTSLENEDIDRDERREMLESFKQVVLNTDIQKDFTGKQLEAAVKLTEIQTENMNFTKDQNKELRSIMTDLIGMSKGGEKNQAVLKGTIDKLHDQLGVAVLTNKALKDELEKPDFPARGRKKPEKKDRDFDFKGGTKGMSFGRHGVPGFSLVQGLLGLTGLPAFAQALPKIGELLTGVKDLTKGIGKGGLSAGKMAGGAMMGMVGMITPLIPILLTAMSGLGIGLLIDKAMGRALDPIVGKLVDKVGEGFDYVVSKIPIIGDMYKEDKEVATQTDVTGKTPGERREKLKGVVSGLEEKIKGAGVLQKTLFPGTVKRWEEELGVYKPALGRMEERAKIGGRAEDLTTKISATPIPMKPTVTTADLAMKQAGKEAKAIKTPSIGGASPVKASLKSGGGTGRIPNIDDNELFFVNRNLGD